MKPKTMQEALEHIIRRLQMDIDDGSRPDHWSMQDLVRVANDALSQRTEQQAGAAEPKGMEPARVRDEAWQPIETAPNAEQRDMFVVRAFNVCNGFTGGRNYTSDAYCVWRDIHGGFARWPHHFAPTHWIPLPAPPVGTPKSAEGGGA